MALPPQTGYMKNMAATKVDAVGNPSVANQKNTDEVIKYNARNGNICVK